MHSHYSAAFSWMLEEEEEEEKGNKANSIQASVWTKVTILIKEILPPLPFYLPPPSFGLIQLVTPRGFHLRSTSRAARSSMAVTKRKNLMKILA